MKHITGLSPLADSFDLFLIDQFGVLHDGQRPYRQSIDTLQMLRDCDKRIVVISNSGKRAALNEQRMTRLGFDRVLYDYLITSGEVAWEIMRTEIANAPAYKQRSCFLVTSHGDQSSVDGLDLLLTDDPSMADLILITATEGDRFAESHYRALLASAARKDTPCLCTNPDKIAFGAHGPCFGAGRIAEIYEELGGSVRWIGKPFAEIYRFSLSAFADVAPSRVLCIGDSIEHDIAGAHGLGLSSLLVTGGILAGQTQDELVALSKVHSAAPDYLMPEFAP